jgi:regulator of cell morphogenesis and NO signaling
MAIGAETAVGVVVADRISRARVFERLGIDYCCHGGTSLAKACAQRSLDVEHVLSELAESDRTDASAEPENYTAMTAAALADHIEQTHHAYLRRELPRLSDLAAKVAEHHAERYAWLHDLQETLSGLRHELELHLLKEEKVLFPLVRQLEVAREKFPVHCGTVANPIRVMEHEHDDAGVALRHMRELTGGYQVPTDGCTSFQALFEGLAALEADLHTHIHKENNILFPRAAALERALA